MVLKRLHLRRRQGTRSPCRRLAKVLALAAQLPPPLRSRPSPSLTTHHALRQTQLHRSLRVARNATATKIRSQTIFRRHHLRCSLSRPQAAENADKSGMLRTRRAVRQADLIFRGRGASPTLLAKSRKRSAARQRRPATTTFCLRALASRRPQQTNVSHRLRTAARRRHRQQRYRATHFELLAHGPESVDPADPIRQRTFWPAFIERWNFSPAASPRRENFLHWHSRLPDGVLAPTGIHDTLAALAVNPTAVIGNYRPGTACKLQEVEWFASACSSAELALAPTAARSPPRHQATARRRATRSPPNLRRRQAARRPPRPASHAVHGHYPLLKSAKLTLTS